MTQKNRRHAPFRVLGCQIPDITAEEVRQAIKNYEAQFLKKDNEKEVVSLDGSLEDIVRRIIKKILQEEQGNQSRTARRLGISRTTLPRHLE